MQIDAINTLEIRFVEQPDPFFERRLGVFCRRFEAAEGCLSFVASRAPCAPRLWILTGHWLSREHMAAHCASRDMAQLVSMLVGLRAHLRFASFAKTLPGTAADFSTSARCEAP